MISAQGKALVCDFTCSRTILASQTISSPGPSTAGACEYLAPELLSFDAATPYKTNSMEADVWAFGMILYVSNNTTLTHFRYLFPQKSLWTKGHPYGGVKGRVAEMAVMSAIVEGKLPEFPKDVKGNDRLVMTRFEEVSYSCWKRDPTTRSSMKDAVQQLQRPIDS